MAALHVLDAHAKPPALVREVYKAFQKLSDEALNGRTDVLDRTLPTYVGEQSTLASLPAEIRQIFLDFLGDYHTTHEAPEDSANTETTSRVFVVTSVPGLYFYPSLLPPDVQLSLLEKLLHRDLSNSEHRTNVHMHYSVPYPSDVDGKHGTSFFDPAAANLSFKPREPDVHKHLSTQQFLNKKLRWVTLGGQYDWTKKVYPTSPAPPFPPDLKELVERIFPMRAEAAIVNVYSPGDTLSMHRDVSEECDSPLVSISLGCDGMFVVGLDGTDDEGRPKIATIRLRSGDAVLMSGESRFAWHGVPKILEGTCPEWIQDWPFRASGGSEQYGEWKGWMGAKRVNLNVRQMFA